LDLVASRVSLVGEVPAGIFDRLAHERDEAANVLIHLAVSRANQPDIVAITVEHTK
jgi:hypothetical protein